MLERFIVYWYSLLFWIEENERILCDTITVLHRRDKYLFHNNLLHQTWANGEKNCHYYFMEYDCLLIKADTSIVFTVLLYLFVMKSFASFPEQLHLITASFLLGWYVLFIYTVIGVFDIYVGIIDLPFSDIILMELMINYSKSVHFLSLFCCRHKLGYGGEW